MSLRVYRLECNGLDIFQSLVLNSKSNGPEDSWPHAHKVEEELVYILKGEPDIWINGKIYGAKAGDFIFFPPGTISALFQLILKCLKKVLFLGKIRLCKK